MVFYFLGIFFVFLYFQNSHHGGFGQLEMLEYFCIAVVWPILALGYIWIYRYQIKSTFVMFFVDPTFELPEENLD
jgi:hypothetical protein